MSKQTNMFQSTNNGPQFKWNESSSKSSLGKKQIQMEPSSDQVIFIANFKRQFDTRIPFPQFEPAFHQALLVVTQKKENQTIGFNVEYHIVEYMDDSKAKGYKINMLGKSKPKCLKDLIDLTEFQDEEFFWIKLSIKKQFDIETLDIRVKDVRVKMQQIADQYGMYNEDKNNCQTVADKLTQQILLEEVSNKKVTFLAQVIKLRGEFLKGESKPHSAILVATSKCLNQKFQQSQKYYIVEYLIYNVDGKNKIRVFIYQFYIKNEPQYLKSFNYFENQKSEWNTQSQISRFHVQQTVQNIFDEMRQNIWMFESESNLGEVVKKIFKKIQMGQNEIQTSDKSQKRRIEELEDKEEESQRAVKEFKQKLDQQFYFYAVIILGFMLIKKTLF